MIGEVRVVRRHYEPVAILAAIDGHVGGVKVDRARYEFSYYRNVKRIAPNNTAARNLPGSNPVEPEEV
jgi:hypothetical protein